YRWCRGARERARRGLARSPYPYGSQVDAFDRDALATQFPDRGVKVLLDVAGDDRAGAAGMKALGDGQSYSQRGSGDQNCSPPHVEGGSGHFRPPFSWSRRNFRTCSLKVSGYWNSEACPESG